MRLPFAVFAALLILPVGPAVSQSDEGPPRWAASLARKQFVIMSGVPGEYRYARDPSVDTAVKVRRGQAVFDRHCAACHGWTGEGTGPEAFALVPAPADLEWMAHTPKGKAEPYMYWTIAEGGAQFESDMPAFKKTLSKADTWAVIAYLRAGMPRKTP